jgi:hypothetical protein
LRSSDGKIEQWRQVLMVSGWLNDTWKRKQYDAQFIGRNFDLMKKKIFDWNVCLNKKILLKLTHEKISEQSNRLSRYEKYHLSNSDWNVCICSIIVLFNWVKSRMSVKKEEYIRYKYDILLPRITDVSDWHIFFFLLVTFMSMIGCP